MKNLFFIFIIIFTQNLFAKFEEPTSTAFKKSILNIDIYINDDFISFLENPSSLANLNNLRYGFDYKNSYFDELFYEFKLYYLRNIKNLGIGLLFSDFVANQNSFNYSELLFMPSIGFKILKSLNAGFTFKIFKINSNFINGTGFNNNLGFYANPFKNFSLELIWNNLLNSPFLWENNKKENFNKELCLSGSYRFNLYFINTWILTEYKFSNLKIENFTVSDKQNELLKLGLILNIEKFFYISGGISKSEKSFGLGIVTRNYIIYFSNSIKDIGTQQSINITLKGGE